MNPNPTNNPFNSSQSDICRKFAIKVIQYFHLTHIPAMANNIYPLYPLYHIPENAENIRYLHDFLFEYFLYFAQIAKPRKLFFGDFVGADQCSELTQLAFEIEKAIGPIQRDGDEDSRYHSSILTIFGNRTLRNIKHFFKHYLHL